MGRTPENPYLVAVKTFPDRLAQAKKFYEFTNAVDLDWNELAQMVHVTKSVMSELKLGKRHPRVLEGVRFALALGVRPEWLLLNSGHMSDEGGGDWGLPSVDPRVKPKMPKQA